ncbi:Hypothetical protein ORPV_1016 [Orpheovirus IHUMI-LCC2]|uniref:Uncharacterized protein n=1 Tax=Orpheovirus IHUMI-LCC2 TaxID=2023057 RepID=A0A2I2L600_9VIRU|nr:Hypothetical protein ORPV_1016 [Orpheovirus IHUMI-LCC2]SNW62920.1 Hypothetical protein ORPV_1016 [Orpheovirus IHUMI-LCC2]
MSVYFIFFVIIIIIIIIFLVYFISNRNRRRGEYVVLSYGDCVPNNPTSICTSTGRPGTRKIIYICDPDPITGMGCIQPNGILSYSTLVSETVCNSSCILSEFKIINTGPCILDNPITNTGFRNITKQCVQVDNDGINNCTIYNKNTNQTIFYAIGDEVTIQEPCDAIVSSWRLPSGGYCTYNTAFIQSDVCPVDPLEEGYILEDMVCSGGQCASLPCSDSINDVGETGGVLCGDNPLCVIPCRNIPSTYYVLSIPEENLYLSIDDDMLSLTEDETRAAIVHIGSINDDMTIILLSSPFSNFNYWLSSDGDVLSIVPAAQYIDRPGMLSSQASKFYINSNIISIPKFNGYKSLYLKDVNSITFNNSLLTTDNIIQSSI